MIVHTSRFGNLEVSETDLIDFPEGILGFSKIRQYFLVERPGDSLFYWLQAVKKPTIAFPLLNPFLIEPEYQIELSENDVATLDAESVDELKLYSIVTIPSDPTKMTGNLKAPIALNPVKRKAKQLILHTLDYPIRRAIYDLLEKVATDNGRPLFQDSGAISFKASSLKALPAQSSAAV